MGMELIAKCDNCRKEIFDTSDIYCVTCFYDLQDQIKSLEKQVADLEQKISDLENAAMELSR